MLLMIYSLFSLHYNLNIKKLIFFFNYHKKEELRFRFGLHFTKIDIWLMRDSFSWNVEIEFRGEIFHLPQNNTLYSWFVAYEHNFKRVVFGYVSPLSIHYCLLIHWFLYTNHLSEQKHRASVNNIIMVWINGKNRRGWFLINNESFMCYFWMKTILHSDNGANTFNARCLNSKIFYGNMQWYAKKLS